MNTLHYTDQQEPPSLSPFQTITDILNSALQQAESLLFLIGIHPGYILFQLGGMLNLLASALGLGKPIQQDEKGGRRKRMKGSVGREDEENDGAEASGYQMQSLGGSAGLKNRRRRAELAAQDMQGAYYPGMVNLSGTLCYMNSVLQSFASLNKLHEHLSQVIKLAEQVDLNTPIADALSETLYQLNTPSTSRPPPLRPYDLIQAISQLPSVRRLLNTREHQDAHELFLLLSTAVEDELKSLEKERRIDGGLPMILEGVNLRRSVSPAPIAGEDGEEEVVVEVKKDKGKQKERLVAPWDGLRAIRRNCLVCGYCEVIRHEVMGAMDVTVPMSGMSSLEQCLDQSMAPEIIDDAYCDSCTLELTMNYYISEEQRLSKGQAKSPTSGIATPPRTASADRGKKDRTAPNFDSNPAINLLNDPAVGDGMSSSGTGEAESKVTSAKKRRAREARAVIRKLEEVKSRGIVSEVVGEGKARGREFGLEAVKWLKATGRSSRMSMIARPPPILTLHLNRSGFTQYGDLVKKTSHIVFPPVLDLSPFTTTGNLSMDAKTSISPYESASADSAIYRLQAIICHYGYTHSFGHFVAYRRKPHANAAHNRLMGGGWLRISDADVDEVSEESVLTERGNAFLLFYERVEGVRIQKQQDAKHKSAATSDMSGSVLDALRKRQASSGSEELSAVSADMEMLE